MGVVTRMREILTDIMLEGAEAVENLENGVKGEILGTDEGEAGSEEAGVVVEVGTIETAHEEGMETIEVRQLAEAKKNLCPTLAPSAACKFKNHTKYSTTPSSWMTSMTSTSSKLKE